MPKNPLKYIARNLRSSMTAHEALLWQRIWKKQILGLQFYRQKPIAGYIVDFYCASAKLVVELDGKQHSTGHAIAYDSERTRILEALGLRIVRIDNIDVIERIDFVLSEITKIACPNHPTQPPFQGREEQKHCAFLSGILTGIFSDATNENTD